MAACDGNTCAAVAKDEAEKKEDNRVEYKKAKVDPMIKMLGQKLLGQEGEVDTSTLKENDVVGFYFSAHWCPPCRGFTPKLAEKYKQLKAAGKKFEIVFLSSDKNDEAFKEYFNEMPWLALPFKRRRAKNKLSNKYNVGGIPTLILVDPKTGATISKEGRSSVMEKEFPWTPSKDNAEAAEAGLVDLLKKGTFLTKEDKEINFDALKENKYLILYFSAHWCPPCRGFTPNFAKWYKKNQPKLAGTDRSFDVVFVSSDRDESSFKDYYKEHPWKALKYSQRDLKNSISSTLGVRGIPSVQVFDLEGNLISDGGRQGVMEDDDAKEFPWLPKMVIDVNKDPSALNNKVCMVFPMEKLDKDKQEARLKILNELGEYYEGTLDDEPAEFGFLYMLSSDSGIGERLRNFLKLPAAKDDDATMYIVDAIEGKKHKSTADITLDYLKSTLDTMIDDYETKIEWKKTGD